MANKKNKLPHHPHDRLFKIAFGRPEVARDFLANRLPAAVRSQVDLNTLVPQKDSFIENDLRASYSDLIFKVTTKMGKQGYLYFLLEHQSSPDPTMPYRLLKYMVAIMGQEVAKQQAKSKTKQITLPVVFPFVIYTGDKKYPYPLRIIDAFAHPGLMHKALDFPSVLPLRDEKQGDIIKDGRAALAEFLMVKSYQRDLCCFLETHNEVAKLLYKSDYYQPAFIYILAHDKHKPKEILEKLPKLGADQRKGIMNALQQLQYEGKREGIKEGIEQTIKDFYKGGIGLKKIAQICKMEEQAIQKIVAPTNV